MKHALALLLVLSISACVVAPDGPGKKAGGGTTGKSGGDTTVICHKGKKTMELPDSAAQAHLNHGDTRGPC